jgi:hypothetical protein
MYNNKHNSYIKIIINKYIMKKLLLSLFLLLSTLSYGQTVIQYDYMETWSTGYATSGWFTPAPTATWATNISVSATQSAVIYGAGNGTSGVEQDWYVLPNITGLNTSHPYQLKFRLASRTFTAPTASTRGVDAADLVEVQVSRNGGAYISELRIAGNSNATWSYTATGVISHNANGSYTNSLAPTGDIYQAPAGSTTTGPSTVTLNLPSGISQIAIDIFCRVNSAGEEWWIDNIELIEIFPLPVELISFEGVNLEEGNMLIWKTASEINSDYYLVEHSTTGEFDENSVIGNKTAAGNSNQVIEYSFLDNNFRETINYYRITQVDFNGEYKIYGPISIDNRTTKKVVIKYVNLLGQVVDKDYRGFFFEVYSDGTNKKIYR